MGNNIDEKLLVVFKEFDKECKKLKMDYDIVSDEQNKQGYLIRNKGSDVKPITDHIGDVADDNSVHMEVNDDHRDGTLYTFTLKAIMDKYGISEDQYKWAPGKVRRKQSMFPQSFGKTKSYGGVVNGYAKINPAPTKVVWRKNVTESTEMLEVARRLKDIDELFIDLIEGLEARDDDKVIKVARVMKELAAGSEALTEVVIDAANSAAYRDINDVGYAYDRFRRTFLTEPVTEAPNVRFTAGLGDDVMVREQFEAELDDGTAVVPRGEVGVIKEASSTPVVSFAHGNGFIDITMSHSMFDKYLRPLSDQFQRRIEYALMTESWFGNTLVPMIIDAKEQGVNVLDPVMMRKYLKGLGAYDAVKFFDVIGWDKGLKIASEMSENR